MPKKKKNNKLPPDVVDHWPDVFDEIEIKAVPIEYIQAVMIYFHTGKVWEINIDQSKVTDQGSDALEQSIEDIIAEYDEEISSVDFRLDTAKVKKDIQRRTKYFMKLRK